MKFSSKIEKCGLSPMRKFAPYANEAAKKGKKLYHLNIGQPDIATPAAYFEAVKNFSQPVLAYAPSDGVPEMIDAVVNYYGKINAPITNKQVLITTGGSEALQIALSCILDEGDEIIIPEPFYPNYSTFVTLTGATSAQSPRPLRRTTSSPSVSASRPASTSTPAPSSSQTPATRPARSSPRKSSVSWPTSPRSITCSSSATRCTASLFTAARSS